MSTENFPDMTPFPYSRIIMLGTTSSGKSTFSKRLAERLGLAWVELDAFHFEPGWKEVPDEIFLARVHAALEADRWIVAGSYHIARDPIWTRADLAIWLDYPFWWIFWKLTTRTVKRWWTRELLWGTNYETLWVHVQPLVARFIDPLAIQNVLEAKARIPRTACPSAIQTHSPAAFPNPRRDRGMAAVPAK